MVLVDETELRATDQNAAYTYVAFDVTAAECAKVLLELYRADMLRDIANEQTHFEMSRLGMLLYLY